MKAFIVFAAVVACAYAKPQFFYNGGFPFGTYGGHYAAAPAVTYSGLPAVHYAGAPALTYAAAPAVIAPAYTATQYHAQDELGQASYGYAHPGQSHAAVRDAFGNVRGSYAYVGADGKEVRVNYLADSVHGFQVESNALPVAPTVPETPALVGPAPVQDTPEVAEARAAHIKAIEEAQARNAEADKQDAAEDKAPAAPASVLVGPSPVQDTPEVVAAKIEHFAAVAEAQARSGRKKRGVVYSGVPALTYGVSPYLHSNVLGGYGYSNQIVHAGVPALTYATAPAVAYNSHIVHGVPALTYAAPAVVATQAVREATLTKVVNTPGHAVSYRVD